MADLSEESLQKFTDALEKFSERFGFATDDLKKSTKSTNKTFAKGNQQLDTLIKRFSKLDDGVLKSSDANRRQSASLRELRKTTDEFSEELGLGGAELVEEIKKLQTKVASVQIGYTLGKALGDTAASLYAFSKDITSGLLGNLTSNASGFKIAADIMSTGVTLAAAEGNTLGNTLKDVGSSIMGFGKRGMVAGLALQGLGEVTKFVAGELSALAKAGIQLLAQEADKLVAAFNQSAASGALFATGMDGFTNAAANAYLTVDQFSNVVKNNADIITKSGLGMAEGAKRIGGALHSGGDSMRISLLKLGYSFEEQAGLVAETMKDMTQNNGPLRASNAEVARQTQLYADNLRTITAITGEDAKKKMDKAREDAAQLRFQQKLAEKTPEQQAAVLRAMGNMNEIQRKNFIDMVDFGTIVNQQGALAQAASQGMSNLVGDTYKAFQTNTLDEFRARELNAQYNSQIQKDMISGSLAVGIATAGAAGSADAAGQAAKGFGALLEEIRPATAEAIKSAEANVQLAKNAQGLSQTVADVATQTQTLKLLVQRDVIDSLGQFSKVVLETVKGVRQMLEEAGVGKGGGNNTSFMDRHGRTMLDIGAGALGAGLEGTVGLLGAGPVGAAAGAVSGATTGTMIGDWLADKLNLPKKADGGVTSGPSIAGEDGPEAVIPLKNGNVPVSIDFSMLTNAMRDQTKYLERVADAVEDSIGIQEKILKAAY